MRWSSYDPPDITPPVITLLGSTRVRLEAKIDIYTEPGYFASDTLDGSLTASVNVTSFIPSEHRIGVYNVTYTVRDAALNVVTVTRTVEIVDTTAPQITLVGLILVRVTKGTLWVEPGYSAEDAYDGNLTSNVVVTGNVFPTNVTGVNFTIQYRVSDSSGNSVSVRRVAVVMEAESSNSAALAPIVGGIVGAVVVLIVVIAVVLFVRRQRREKLATNTRKSNAYLLAAGLKLSANSINVNQWRPKSW
jgi:hypothetical protein